MESITPYLLPAPVLAELLELAAPSDLLVLGEMHGIQEVPRLVLGLLPELETLGYRGLGMEIPFQLRERILDWVQGRSSDPTYFFEPRTIGDGRESVQAVSLFRQMLGRAADWNLLCFDNESPHPNWSWEERDAAMATALADQWQRLCPGRKVIGICGNYHSRLTPGAGAPTEFWPAFAAKFAQSQPEFRVASVNLVFHNGAFHNGGDRPLGDPMKPSTLTKPEIRPSEDQSHTLELHLPFATPVTFFQNASEEATTDL